MSSEVTRGRFRAGLRWTGRFVTIAAFASLAWVVWTRAAEIRRPRARTDYVPLRVSPVAVDWRREPFREWFSPEDRIRLEYPSRFDAVRGLGRFTSRALQDGIEETDVVAFRSAEPRAVITVASYRSSRARSWTEWAALAKAAPPPAPRASSPTPFCLEFGGTGHSFRQTRVADRPALVVSARGAVQYPARGNDRMELWRFESRLLAEGDRAVRITAGVHTDHYESTLPALRRSLDSFRWRNP